MSIINSTTESQGHGKAMERNIQQKIFKMTDEQIKSYKNTDIHDILSCHNNHELCKNKNVSIKTTTRSYIDCGDILRFISSTNTIMICICMIQKNDIMKEAIKTIYFSVDEYLEKLFSSFNDEYKNNIKIYIDHIKQVPTKTKTKDLSINKKIYETKSFKIRPKPSQNRVQCSIKIDMLKTLDSYKEFDGGYFFNDIYDKEIKSKIRSRNVKIK
tara:strand:+ start:87 stop:728 length:642 start_codon:yes stop_codon:yes gene_type:complete